MDHNPYLTSWRRHGPNHVAGKGRIETPEQERNIPWQTRPASPTDYENTLGDALQEIFDADIVGLADVVGRLNAMGVRPPYGAAWTEESFRAEMKRLGA